MSGSSLRLLIFSLFATLALAACGPGRPREASPKAVGYDSALGRTLTGAHWCSAPSEDLHPDFIELELRQNGQYVKSFHRLGADNSLERRGEERGTWAIVGDQLFTRTIRQARTRQKLSVRTAETGASVARVTKRDQTETCLDLTDAVGTARSYCSCQVN